jgi:hypothetical protein
MNGLGSYHPIRPVPGETQIHTVIWKTDYPEGGLDVTTIPDTIFGHHALRTLT